MNCVKSNSFTTGISSMTTPPHYRRAHTCALNAGSEFDIFTDTPTNVVENYPRIYSQKLLATFAGVTQLRPALLTQVRSSQVVTRVPKSAVWLLIAANMLFALFAVAMATYVLSVASIDVHQVHTRLSISGWRRSCSSSRRRNIRFRGQGSCLRNIPWMWRARVVRLGFSGRTRVVRCFHLRGHEVDERIMGVALIS